MFLLQPLAHFFYCCWRRLLWGCFPFGQFWYFCVGIWDTWFRTLQLLNNFCVFVVIIYWQIVFAIICRCGASAIIFKRSIFVCWRVFTSFSRQAILSRSFSFFSYIAALPCSYHISFALMTSVKWSFMTSFSSSNTEDLVLIELFNIVDEIINRWFCCIPLHCEQ